MDNGCKQLPDFKVQVIVEPDEDGFHAYCPALKGLHVSGSTEDEALQNVSNAAMAYIESLVKHGDPIPIGIVPCKTASRKRYFLKHRTRQCTKDLVLSRA